MCGCREGGSLSIAHLFVRLDEACSVCLSVVLDFSQ